MPHRYHPAAPRRRRARSAPPGNDPARSRPWSRLPRWRRFPNAELREGDPDFCQQMAEIFAHLDDSRRPVSLPLDLQGTAFQLQVWQALRQIPAGETRSYRQVAEHIGQPRAVRAVAGACAANSLAVIVPCHRVVREDGALSGYRWGTARKAQLLAREAQYEEE